VIPIVIILIIRVCFVHVAFQSYDEVAIVLLPDLELELFFNQVHIWFWFNIAHCLW
jgi:hypothetical protein